MSAKQRILAGALALFNADGYAPATALSIATALGMSPGHLYYHFKGKAEIAAALFAAHAEEIALILAAAAQQSAAPADETATLVTALHILLEEKEDYRFLYQEYPTLARAHPALAGGLARLAKEERGALAALLKPSHPAQAPALAQALQVGLWALPAQLEYLEGIAEPRARAALGAQRLAGLLARAEPPLKKALKAAPAPPKAKRGSRKKV